MFNAGQKLAIDQIATFRLGDLEPGDLVLTQPSDEAGALAVVALLGDTKTIVPLDGPKMLAVQAQYNYGDALVYLALRRPNYRIRLFGAPSETASLKTREQIFAGGSISAMRARF